MEFSMLLERQIMNKDQVKGKVKEVAGEVQEHSGKMTGSAAQQAKGHNREMAGKAQKAVGDGRENLKDLKDINKR
ncbi:CsbD family protein [Polaromonas sp.]|uniref:CsbD family protein n=1 Tax=Polaromonas sp. TaxID=1869339 RepID=UPI00356244F5